MTGVAPKDLLRQEAAFLTSGLALQHQGLSLLLAEMEALAALIPGNHSHAPTEAETEAGFDNLPV